MDPNVDSAVLVVGCKAQSGRSKMHRARRKAGRRSVEGSASDLRFMQMKNVWIRALSTCFCFIFL